MGRIRLRKSIAKIVPDFKGIVQKHNTRTDLGRNRISQPGDYHAVTAYPGGKQQMIFIRAKKSAIDEGHLVLS